MISSLSMPSTFQIHICMVLKLTEGEKHDFMICQSKSLYGEIILSFVYYIFYILSFVHLIFKTTFMIFILGPTNSIMNLKLD
jgi:hypothetical protein